MFSKELTDWVSGRVKQWLTSDNTVESMLKQLLSIDNGKDQLVIKSRTWLKERLKQYVQKHQDTAAKQLVPQEIQSAIVSYLPGLSKTMVSKAKVYVESAEGQEKNGCYGDELFVVKRQVWWNGFNVSFQRKSSGDGLSRNC